MKVLQIGPLSNGKCLIWNDFEKWIQTFGNLLFHVLVGKRYSSSENCRENFIIVKREEN